MRREQNFPLPREIIERAQAEGNDDAFSQVMERALNRVLDGTPEERKSMMFAALPFMENQGEIFNYALIVESGLFRRFDELCQQKSLNGVVLMIGAMLAELEMGGAAPSGDACVSPHH